MENLFYIICRTGFVSTAFVNESDAKSYAEDVYYNGEDYKIVKGSENFRKEYELAYSRSEEDVKDIRNNRKWNKFIKNFGIRK